MNILSCLILAGVVTGSSATALAGSEICEQLRGKMVPIRLRVDVSNETGVRLHGCEFNTGEKGSKRTAIVDPRMWVNKTLAGSVFNNDRPISFKAFSKENVPWIGSVLSCATFGAIGTGSLFSLLSDETENGGQMGICTFEDSSFIDFWTLVYTSFSTLEGTGNIKYRKFVNGIPTFKGVQLKTKGLVNNESIYYEPVELTACRTHKDCTDATVPSCSGQHTSRCSKGVCRPRRRDLADCTQHDLSNCSTTGMLKFHHTGRKAYCMRGEPRCVRNKCHLEDLY
mmetsp:Transcript_18496/g.40030  ORF Transcript_18496/g.40030 Transcript_18496/m.40030 type:complete len:283 (-) Transcript_18496:29-877(-)